MTILPRWRAWWRSGGGARPHLGFLRRSQPFKAGVPSHDTLNDALAGALVTIDAMGTQTKIAQAIRGGDGLLAAKDSQPNLHDEIRRHLDGPAATIHSRFETIGADHGPIAIRRPRDTA